MPPSLLPVPRAGFVTSEHVCFFRGDSRTTAELIAAKTPSPTCTLYLINRDHAFTQDVLKTLCLLFVGVIIATAIALFLRSRMGQSKARGEEGDGLINGELSDGSIKKAPPFLSSSPAPPVGEKKGPFSLLGCASPRPKGAPKRSIVDMYKQQAGPALHLSKWTPGEHPPAEAAALTEIARAFLSNTQSAGLSTADELRPELGAVATKAAATQVRVRVNPHRSPNPNPNPSPSSKPNPNPDPNPNPKQDAARAALKEMDAAAESAKQGGLCGCTSASMAKTKRDEVLLAAPSPQP